MTTEPDLVRAGPVRESDRIVTLDVLRGFAVLGILVMNIQAFTMPGVAYMNPTVYGDLESANYWVWYVGHLLTDQKMYTLFSMLFGAGVVLMTSRAEATGRGSAGVHYRRMGWLILFGLLHAHLLWYGDILYTYGMCGLLVWLARRWRPWVLIGVGVILIAIASLISFAFGWSMQFWPPEAVTGMAETSWQPTPEILQAEIDAYRGSWWEQMPKRVGGALFFQTGLLIINIGWRTLGVMLVGMALYKLGVLSGSRSSRFYLALVAIAALVALPLIAIGAHQHFAHDWSVEYSFFFGIQYNFWASHLVSLGWIGVVILACRARVLAGVTRVLAAVGRMALTNYLAQTVICTTLFYGHGFGLYGDVERVGQISITVAIWVVQLAWSPIWLHYFQYGPAEWLWRSLTYWKRQPMRRAAG